MCATITCNITVFIAIATANCKLCESLPISAGLAIGDPGLTRSSLLPTTRNRETPQLSTQWPAAVIACATGCSVFLFDFTSPATSAPRARVTSDRQHDKPCFTLLPRPDFHCASPSV
ncbi:hypothetical protein BC834DRAFT_902898 [Gloeopeniophorella convolvens]|nr:hypothetical protein BC834DRAFT_902898 [Gloeopeniophorella convolvens]